MVETTIVFDGPTTALTTFGSRSSEQPEWSTKVMLLYGWEAIKDSVKTSTLHSLRRAKKSKDKSCISHDTWILVREKRRLKNTTVPEKHHKSRSIKKSCIAKEPKE